MAYPGSAAAPQPARGGDQSKLATLARLFNPGAASPFRSSYTGDVANDGPGGKPLGRSPTRQQLALILAGDTTTADPGTGTGSGSGSGSGDGGTGQMPIPDPATAPQHGGSGPGGLGNAGGASQPGNAGAAGDAAGHPGGGGFRSATPSDVASRASTGDGTAASGESDRGYFDIGPVGKGLLSAASIVAPMPYSAIPSLIGAGGRAYNALGPTSDIRRKQGLPSLDFGQIVGAIGDLNGYGDMGGNATVANPEQLGERLRQVPAYNVANDFFGNFGQPAETQKGASYQPGPGGILGFLMRTFGLTDAEARALSPDETDRLLKIKPPDPDIAALWAGTDAPAGFNSGHGGQVAATGAGMNAGQLAAAGLGYDPTTGGFVKTGPTQMQVGGGGGNNQGNAAGGANNQGDAGRASGANPGTGQNVGPGAHDTGTDAAGFALGGWVPGRPDRIVDNRRGRLDEGEFVVRRGQARRFAPLLEAINSGSIVPPAGRSRMPAMAF